MREDVYGGDAVGLVTGGPWRPSGSRRINAGGIVPYNPFGIASVILDRFDGNRLRSCS